MYTPTESEIAAWIKAGQEGKLIEAKPVPTKKVVEDTLQILTKIFDKRKQNENQNSKPD